MAFYDILKFRKKRSLEKQGPASRRQQKSDTATMRPKAAKGIGWVAALCVLMIWIGCCFSIIYRFPSFPDLVVGQKCPENLIAEVTFRVKNRAALRQEENKAARVVPNTYNLNTKAWGDRKNRLRDLFIHLRQMTTVNPAKTDFDEEDVPDEHLDIIRRLIPDEETARSLLAVFSRGEKGAIDVMGKLSKRDEDWVPVLSDDDYHRQRLSEPGLVFLDAQGERRTFSIEELVSPAGFADRYFEAYFNKISVPKGEALELAKSLIAVLIIPDLDFDEAKTEAALAKALDKVPRVFNRDKLIVKQGDKITQRDMILIREHEIEKHQRQIEKRASKEFFLDSTYLASACLFSIIGWLVLISTVLPKISHKRGTLFLLSLVVFANGIFLWGTNYAVMMVLEQPPHYVYAALPLAFGSVLLTILFSQRVGILVGLIVTVLHAIQNANGAPFILVLGVTTSVVGALAVQSVRTRLQISRAAIYVPLTTFGLVTIYLLTHQSYQWIGYAKVLGISLAGGVALVIVVNLLLPLLEFAFGLTTDISLLELSDLNHPLLKRLSLEAPGTYAHTMMVATLAEHAAEAIGANTLLTRVMSYFHDIGKMANPGYFTENSFDGNLHEDLSPKMSARIILNHVKEGLNMAAKYKLKEPLREAIATHHGNGLVYYFYHRAKTENTLEDSGGENEYRYPGPNPRSPEATIIALADSCEAASRSLEKPTPQKIDSLVDDIFKGKLFGGQMDDTELTMAKLLIARETIKKTLRVMLHSRIAYPKNEEVEKKMQSAAFAEKSQEIERSKMMNLREKEKEQEQEQTSKLQLPPGKKVEAKNPDKDADNLDKASKAAKAVDTKEKTSDSSDDKSEQSPAKVSDSKSRDAGRSSDSGSANQSDPAAS